MRIVLAHVKEQTLQRLRAPGYLLPTLAMPGLFYFLFEGQDESYRNAVLGSAPRAGVEAASEFGWSKWLGPNGTFIGMHGFGASAPAQDLYKHFGITADAVAAAARGLIQKSRSRGGHG